MIKIDVKAEIRRLHVVVSDLAKQFKLSRPAIRKHLKTIEERVDRTRQQRPICNRAFIKRLTTWLETDAALTLPPLPGKKPKPR